MFKFVFKNNKYNNSINMNQFEVLNNIEINSEDNSLDAISNVSLPEKLHDEPIEKLPEEIPTIPKEETSSPKVLTLNTTANEVSKNYSNVRRIEYGTSVNNRPLEAYLISGNGKNTKTIFMEFEVHGYEDEYSKDGEVLVNLANDLIKYYAENPNYLKDYQMIIVPSANPDGVIDGENNLRVGNKNAFGRCTAAGIDINRDFKSGSFKAIESQKLKELMDRYPMDIHLDFHGWEDSCIGNPVIVDAFLDEVGLTTDKSNRYGSGQGYVIEYTKDTYGASSALVEFKNSNSVHSSNVENAINRILDEI